MTSSPSEKPQLRRTSTASAADRAADLPVTADNLIVGCGDVGTRLARELKARGERVAACVRSVTSAETLRSLGIESYAIDLDDGAHLPACAQIYWFAPPPAQGQTDPRIRRWIAGGASNVRRVVYLSTSAVYGDCGGRWIDEDESLKPQTDRGRRRLDAERALETHASETGVELVILRVPGIYGPGRLPLERLRQNLPVIQDSGDDSARRWTNRIHADDLALAARAAMSHGQAGRAYNIADGNPTTMADYFSRCARLLGLPEPPRVALADAPTHLSPALMSFMEESKRLRNRRMVEELGVVLRYPDLDHGLPACLD